MKLVSLKEIFTLSYGNKFDLNKMDLSDDINSNTINFVSRSSKNLGISAIVNEINSVKPNEAGLITVALGGAILSSFIQPKNFYTAQNVMILIPKKEMSFLEKLYYCKCIEKNKFRYSTFGREANRTLKDILVPKDLPNWIDHIQPEKINDKSSVLQKKIPLCKNEWQWFSYKTLFSIERGTGAKKNQITKSGVIPLISSTEQNNGLIGKINGIACHKGNVISVVRNGGSVASAFFQNEPFASNEDVHIFNPKFDCNIYRAMFLIPLIRLEKYRYSYGRKWSISRMNKTLIKLPVKKRGVPDWDFMEDYIKSLPYSKSL